MSEEKIKACPFCRADGIIVTGHPGGDQVQCSNRGGCWFSIIAVAKHQWQTRAGDHEPAMSKTPDASTLASAQCSAAWRADEPPKDGTVIVAIGRVVASDEVSTWVDSFVADLTWHKDESGYEGWHYGRDNMTVARTLSDQVKIDWWMPMPPNDPS